MTQLIRFAVVGAIGFVVDTAVLYLMLALSADFMVGRAVSFLCAVYATWQINRRFTFRSAGNGNAWHELGRYFLAMLGGGAVNLLTYRQAMVILPGSWITPALAVGFGSLAGLIVNFIGAKLFVYRSRS